MSAIANMATLVVNNPDITSYADKPSSMMWSQLSELRWLILEKQRSDVLWSTQLPSHSLSRSPVSSASSSHPVLKRSTARSFGIRFRT